MLGLGWQELIIVVLAIVLIAGFFGIGKLGGDSRANVLELIGRFTNRAEAGERGSTTL